MVQSGKTFRVNRLLKTLQLPRERARTSHVQNHGSHGQFLEKVKFLLKRRQQAGLMLKGEIHVMEQSWILHCDCSANSKTSICYYYRRKSITASWCQSIHVLTLWRTQVNHIGLCYSRADTCNECTVLTQYKVCSNTGWLQKQMYMTGCPM